jgi:hypothetical protein
MRWRRVALRLSTAIVLAAALAGTLAGCSGTSDGSPKGVVEQALRLVEDKDTDGLAALACEAQRATVVEQFDLTGLLGAALPGDVDVDALIEAIQIDASRVVVTEKSVTGDQAVVTLAGSIGMTIDEEQFKDAMRAYAQSQGIELDDAQLGTMLLMLGSYTEAIPMNLDVDLVREGGTWKICD